MYRQMFLSLAVVLTTAHPLRAQDAAPQEPALQDPAPEPFVCVQTPEPVISLSHGSRYSSSDSSRTEFDEASNEDVNAQLKPVDQFITDLAKAANRAVSTPADRQIAADCVLTGLAVWAGADALSDLATMNAQLSAPSRIAGLAFAYAQIDPFLEPSEDRDIVQAWLSDRARDTITYFDSDAPPKASQNNLRAWAALAVARVGVTVDDAAMIDWAAASVELVACQAAPDGSLPQEMIRKNLALHYQLHAVTPLVVTAALLQQKGFDLFRACDNAIHRTVDFSLASFEDPAVVEDLTGHPQTYFDGTETLRGFEFAWAQAYLSIFYAPQLAGFVEQFGDLANSKIGGKQALIWGD